MAPSSLPEYAARAIDQGAGQPRSLLRLPAARAASPLYARAASPLYTQCRLANDMNVTFKRSGAHGCDIHVVTGRTRDFAGVAVVTEVPRAAPLARNRKRPAPAGNRRIDHNQLKLSCIAFPQRVPLRLHTARKLHAMRKLTRRIRTFYFHVARMFRLNPRPVRDLSGHSGQFGSGGKPRLQFVNWSRASCG